jgi:hypothetical protein
MWTTSVCDNILIDESHTQPHKLHAPLNDVNQTKEKFVSFRYWWPHDLLQCESSQTHENKS